MATRVGSRRGAAGVVSDRFATPGV
jgi:hypothetical protein